MFKNSILVSAITVAGFAVSCGADQASAMKLLERPMEQWQRSIPNHSTSSAVRSDCPNLAGKWVGKCTDQSGTPSDETLNIEQTGCDKIKFEGDEVTMGGMDAAPSPQRDGKAFMTVMADWNTGLTGMDLRFNYITRRLNQPVYGYGQGRYSYEIVGNTLLRRVEAVFTWEASGQTHQGTHRERCEYKLAD